MTFFKKMKKNSIFVNTSKVKLLKTSLVKALKNGIIKSAVV